MDCCWSLSPDGDRPISVWDCQALGIVISTVFSDPNTASITAIFVYLIGQSLFSCSFRISHSFGLLSGIFVPRSLVGLDKGVRLMLALLLSPFGFFWGFSIFGTYEGASMGVTMESLPDAAERGFADPMYLWQFWLGFVADTVMYYLLAFYLDQIVEGEFGAKQPFYFPLLPSYWCPASPDMSTTKVQAGLVRTAVDDVEQVDESRLGPPAIRIEGLRKVFGSKVAVEDFSLDVYEGQITALLGCPLALSLALFSHSATLSIPVCCWCTRFMTVFGLQCLGLNPFGE